MRRSKRVRSGHGTSAEIDLGLRAGKTLIYTQALDDVCLCDERVMLL